LSQNNLTTRKKKIVNKTGRSKVTKNSKVDNALKEAAMILVSMPKCLEMDVVTPSHKGDDSINTNVHEVYQTLHLNSSNKDVNEVFQTPHSDSYDKNVIEVCQMPQSYPIKYVNVMVDSPLKAYFMSIIGVTHFVILTNQMFGSMQRSVEPKTIERCQLSICLCLCIYLCIDMFTCQWRQMCQN